MFIQYGKYDPERPLNDPSDSTTTNDQENTQNADTEGNAYEDQPTQPADVSLPAESPGGNDRSAFYSTSQTGGTVLRGNNPQLPTAAGRNILPAMKSKEVSEVTVPTNPPPPAKSDVV